MATGDIKLVYAASSSITVTNLHSLAASSTYLSGWESGAIDNTSNLYQDYRIALHLVTHASNRQVGEIRVYLVGPNDDTTWPDVFDGTESTESLTSAATRDSHCRIARAIVTSATASEVYDIHVNSVKAVFGGNLPKKFVIFVTGNAATSTNAQFASSGSTVLVTGSYANVSP